MSIIYSNEVLTERKEQKYQARVEIGMPVVIPMAQMELMDEGLIRLTSYVHSRRPECLPEYFNPEEYFNPYDLLFPHKDHVSHNELLAELAGRTCYYSFGLKAGRKSNKDYLTHTQEGEVPHRSIFYHAKMTFFLAGVSRRLSHEMIRNYVGSDRTEEGAPSQESTRYVENAGEYIAHPGLIYDDVALSHYIQQCHDNYNSYRSFIDFREERYREENNGKSPTGMDRKRIFETASSLLEHSVSTSFVWTTNPIALAKLIQERQHESADLEFQRLAQIWKLEAVTRWPNLFPQPWMK